MKMKIVLSLILVLLLLGCIQPEKKKEVANPNENLENSKDENTKIISPQEQGLNLPNVDVEIKKCRKLEIPRDQDQCFHDVIVNYHNQGSNIADSYCYFIESLDLRDSCVNIFK